MQGENTASICMNTRSFDCISLILQWLIQHPQYLENILYIGGDSYSGIPLPIIVQEIYDGKLYCILNLLKKPFLLDKK